MDNWRKSSYSGEGDGNACVEIAAAPARIALRDTKARHRATVTVSATAFVPFLEALKKPGPSSAPR